jgi:Cu+-exporting ATPase
MAKDPVCGMTVDEATAKWTSDDEATAKWTSEYKGETYYFCNERCKLAFEKAPERFVK